MYRLVPFVYALLVVWLLHDCYKARREPFWFLILLLPFWGPFFYIYRFKWRY